MKKLTLKALELGATQFLTREQLKNVVGGSDSGGQTCTYTWDCGQGSHCANGKCVKDTGSCSNCPIGWHCNSANICVYG